MCASEMERDYNKYEACCLFETFHNCGPTSQNQQRKKLDWPDNCIDFGTLSTIDVIPYLISLGMISNSTDQIFMSEKQLIMNRIAVYTSANRNSSVICPLHRYTFGIHWKDNPKCGHPDHPQSRRIPKGNCRRAKLEVAKVIPGFIYGSRLCPKHRNNSGRSDYDDDEIPINNNDEFTALNFLEEEKENISIFIDHDKRSQFNTILSGTSVSPLKSSVIKPLEQQSDSSLRRLTAKYKRGIESLKEEFAEAIAPTQGHKLIRLIEESNANKNENSEKETITEIIEQLKLLHKAYVAHKVPFREQIQLLSLLPKSWSIGKIMLDFNCSKYAAKLAKKIRQQSDYTIEYENDSTQHRQRTDPSISKHFISWLVESGCLVSGTYGLTKMKMDDGTKIHLPKQILRTQKYHIIMQYKKYCDETNFNGYGITKLYDILNSINPSQQHALAGLDEFVTDGIEAWTILKDMIEKLPIPQIEKKRLQKQVEIALLYQKHGYLQHCVENATCLYHCIDFALSDPKTKEFRSSCSAPHTEKCPECDNVFCTLAEIEFHISNIIDSEDRQEFLYDFQNATESVIELFRHIIRGVCQDNEKSNIIKNLSSDSTFAVFDWGQKIIPQAYRESQKDYFGKKGLSLLVGSFLIRNSQTTTITKTTNTTALASSDNASYVTSTYMVALTFANQNDLDTLSATQIITQKFHEDHPFVKYVFKRSDNAGNFSSHPTAEAEYLICKKFDLQLVVRDYSEVQRGKDICDRMCGVAKSRMRSWHHSGHDILNAFDVKEGMQAYGGIKNLKIAVGEIVDGRGYLSQSIIPNVSSVRSIRYSKNGMLIHKASGIGSGLYVPFKNIEFDINMKLLSNFDSSINVKSSQSIQMNRQDRSYNEQYWCPVDNCIMVFSSQEDLDVHVIANQHQMHIASDKKISSNDAARVFLMESLKTININSQKEVTTIIQQQSPSQLPTTSKFSTKKFVNYLNCEGWALRVRKPGQRISQDVKDFIQNIWKDNIQNGRKIKAEDIYEKIRRERNNKNEKLFKPDQYVSIAQIKYQIKKLNDKYGISTEQQLISDLLIQTQTATTTL